MKKLLVFISVLAIALTNVNAQSINEAGTKFNEANESFKAKDFPTAIASFTEALAICESLGEEGAELGGKIKNIIPTAYTNYGTELYKSKKFDEAISTLKTGIAEAQKYGNAKEERKATRLIGNIYFTKAGVDYKAGNLDASLQNCNNAIEYNPKAHKAYLYKAIIYSERKDEANMVEAATQAVNIAEADGDVKTANAARSTVTTYFINAAQESFGKKSYDSTIKSLDKALAFEPTNQTALYIKASSYNALQKYNEAVETGLLGLTAPNEDNDQLLGINLELARAYEALGDNANACTYYKEAAKSPNFKAEAEAKMKDVLKCQ